MNSQEIVDRVIAALSPERLHEVIERIARTQAADNREGVAIGPIMDALTGEPNLMDGAGGWDAYLKLRQAIREMVSQIKGMRYIEADA
jgi:hypothetical protein